MPDEEKYVPISGSGNQRDFLWLEDSLGYNPDSSVAFNTGTNAQSSVENNLISARDRRGNDIEEFERITGYEGEVVGIDTYGKMVGFDGIEFVFYDATENYSASQREEREWGVSDPVEEFIKDQAHNGPWISIQKDLDGDVKQKGRDLSSNTIVDGHAAKRWNQRSSVSYDNIIEELEDSKIYPVPEGESRLDDLDFVRRNPNTGLIFPQKGNRIVTSLPRLDMLEPTPLRQKYRNFFNKSE